MRHNYFPGMWRVDHSEQSIWNFTPHGTIELYVDSTHIGFLGYYLTFAKEDKVLFTLDGKVAVFDIHPIDSHSICLHNHKRGSHIILKSYGSIATDKTMRRRRQ